MSVRHLTHVEEFSNHDNSRFNFNGTVQPCNAFKINNFLTNFNFERPEGDLTWMADYTIFVPGTEAVEAIPGTPGGTGAVGAVEATPDRTIKLGVRPITIPANITTLDNARDFFAFNNSVGNLVVFTPSTRYQDVNLRFEIPNDLLNPPGGFNPPLPMEGVRNITQVTVPARSDAKRLGFNPTDTTMLYSVDDVMQLREPPAPELSFYMDTGSTHENSWHIGDITADKNPHIQSLKPDVLRRGWYPISRSNNFNIHVRDHFGNSVKGISNSSQVRLNTTFGTHYDDDRGNNVNV